MVVYGGGERKGSRRRWVTVYGGDGSWCTGRVGEVYGGGGYGDWRDDVKEEEEDLREGKCTDRVAEVARYGFTAVERPEGFLVLAIASLGKHVTEFNQTPEAETRFQRMVLKPAF
ncbi:hypothetical protein Vadar_023116 [Vaccinium darrowii]|uniref:Uncharacterized protein n=1 Tax=Vaccinium darrowii TaxID=229202 RepID=A0ACB7YFY9_9ERIC|nr:hypothetical protein Vadar_023116 [Vaccinium darrowii]